MLSPCYLQRDIPHVHKEIQHCVVPVFAGVFLSEMKLL